MSESKMMEKYKSNNKKMIEEACKEIKAKILKEETNKGEGEKE